jgi:hypothetical protein
MSKSVSTSSSWSIKLTRFQNLSVGLSIGRIETRLQLQSVLELLRQLHNTEGNSLFYGDFDPTGLSLLKNSHKNRSKNRLKLFAKEEHCQILSKDAEICGIFNEKSRHKNE